MTPSGIQFMSPGSYSYTAESGWGGGAWGGTVNVSPATVNQPPSVSISNPADQAVFTAPATFTFAADASDPDNGVMDVEFYVGNTLVDDVYSWPYSTTVTNLAAGTYTLKAIAWDYSYARATNSISITVSNPPPITLNGATLTGNQLVFQVNGPVAGTTNVVECSTNMVDWFPVLTNISDGTPLGFTNTPSGKCQFFRVVQMN